MCEEIGWLNFKKNGVAIGTSFVKDKYKNKLVRIPVAPSAGKDQTTCGKVVVNLKLWSLPSEWPKVDSNFPGTTTVKLWNNKQQRVQYNNIRRGFGIWNIGSKRHLSIRDDLPVSSYFGLACNNTGRHSGFVLKNIIRKMNIDCYILLFYDANTADFFLLALNKTLTLYKGAPYTDLIP